MRKLVVEVSVIKRRLNVTPGVPFDIAGGSSDRWKVPRIAAGATVGVLVLLVGCKSGKSEPKTAFQWERAELAADGRTLTVSYLGGRCVGDDTNIEGGHPTFTVDDRGDVVAVTLRGDKLDSNKLCAGVGLSLSATVVLPRMVEPTVIADGACDPHDPRSATWLRYRSRNPLPTDPPPDDPCAAGSPRVRSAVADTCSTQKTPSGSPRVVPTVSLAPADKEADVIVDVTVSPGGPCHLDDFQSPTVFSNPDNGLHPIPSAPSWGTALRADVGSNGGHFRSVWIWKNWCGPEGVFGASTSTLSGRSSQNVVRTNVHPPCHDPAAPNALTLLQPFRGI